MSKAPHVERLEAEFEALGAAATGSTVVGRAPFAGTVSAVRVALEANVTGAATNNRTLSVVNRGQDGNGTTVVASLTFDSGVNALDYDELALTLSGTPANLVVAEGDILEFRSAHAGTGLADPGGHVTVELSRT